VAQSGALAGYLITPEPQLALESRRGDRVGHPQQGACREGVLAVLGPCQHTEGSTVDDTVFVHPHCGTAVRGQAVLFDWLSAGYSVWVQNYV